MFVIIICQSMRVNCNFFLCHRFQSFRKKEWVKWVKVRDRTKSQMKFDRSTKYQFAKIQLIKIVAFEMFELIAFFFFIGINILVSFIYHLFIFQAFVLPCRKRQTLSTQCKTLYEIRKSIRYSHNIPIISLKTSSSSC